MRKEPQSRRSISWVVVIGLFAAFLLGTQFHNISVSRFSGVKVNSANKNLPSTIQDKSIDEVYSTLKDKFDGKLDTEKLIDGMKKGLVEAAGDPYTTYLSPDDAKLFNSQINGSFEGIGAELGKEKEQLIVVTPIDGYPAQKAGVKSKDIIVSIDGQDTSGLSLDDAVLKIRGKAGTKVSLKILRGTEYESIDITREEIKIASVKTEYLENNTIGYIRLTQFGNDTDDLADKAAQEMKDKGVKAVILDLRNNPGGLLTSSTHIAGLWLDKQIVVQEKRDGQVIDTLKSTGKPLLAGLPTVILVNDGSASASEIVAGALQDYGTATLVGVKTYGKGSVQELIDLDNGGVAKVTIARWFTPKGKNIDKQGIKPDIEVQPGTDPAQDIQRNKAIEVLKSKIGN